MEVISGDAKGTRIARRPYTDERPLDIFETEFRLSLGRGEKPRALAGPFHCACMHTLENAIHTQGIEQIFGFAVRIAGSLQVVETADTPNFKVLIRLKSAYNRKRNLEIVPPSLHRAVADPADLPFPVHAEADELAAAWSGRRTSRWQDWRVVQLAERKKRLGATVSVVIPARDEERTVAGVVTAIARLAVPQLR